jgi:cell division septal protein FtsQ
MKRKILRTKPAILVRRYFLLFLVLFVFVITTVLGFYNIKRIEFTENENKYVKESDIRNLLNDFIGENFFLINPENAEEKIYTNSYV